MVVIRKPSRRVRAALLAAALALGAGCTPVVMPAGPPIAAPAVAGDAILAADGARLPLRTFRPEGAPRAVLLALHGFNDHSGNFLADSIAQLNAAGVLVYAYDQRGFGRAPNRGLWPGATTLAEDAATAAQLLRARHPALPLLLLGESMGAAVAILAAGLPQPPPVDGYVLLAPALWSRENMPAVMRGSLWLAGRTMPVMAFGGGVGGIVASDNPAALRRLGRDPLVLRNTRVDAAIGLVDLMDAAVAALPGCCRGTSGAAVPALVLYGAQDMIVPARPARLALRQMPAEAPIRLGVYEAGFHLLLADTNREAVARDILAFITDPRAPLPSGADAFAPEWLAR
jgi:alpha-beta hydrolase superfamily lysophospholipase